MEHERYELKNIKEAFSLIKDKELETVYRVFSKDFSAFEFKGIYTSLFEISEGIKERIFDGIKSRYTDIKLDISRLRKFGLDVGVLDLTVLSIPLKGKIFLSNFCLKNYNVIIKIFTDSEKELAVLLKNLDEKEKEVQELSKKKEDNWKENKKNRKILRDKWAGDTVNKKVETKEILKKEQE